MHNPRNSASRSRVGARWQACAEMLLSQPNAARSGFPDRRVNARAVADRPRRQLLLPAGPSCAQRDYAAPLGVSARPGFCRCNGRAHARLRVRSRQPPAATRFETARRLALRRCPLGWAVAIGGTCALSVDWHVRARSLSLPPPFRAGALRQQAMADIAGLSCLSAETPASALSSQLEVHQGHRARGLCAPRQLQPSGRPKSLAACVGHAANSRNTSTARKARSAASSPAHGN